MIFFHLSEQILSSLSASKYELDKFPFTAAQHVVDSGKC